jgi:hypothetical protein
MGLSPFSLTLRHNESHFPKLFFSSCVCVRLLRERVYRAVAWQRQKRFTDIERAE